jgi:hypothetical protein
MVMGEDLDTAKPWNYHDSPKAIGTITIAAAVLGIALALALDSGGERTRVATAPSSQAPMTAPPVVPVPPVGSNIEPKI